MNEERPPTAADSDARDPTRPDARYDLWFDGLLAGEEAAALRRSVAEDPRVRARYEADRAIEASLRRSFGAERPARPRPSGVALSTPLARPRLAWNRHAAAAGMVALVGATALGVAAWRSGGPWTTAPAGPGSASVPTKFAVAALPVPGEVRAGQCALGDVFLDALAVDFQPLLGCKVQDDWNARLLAQLENAPCNREEGVVVLGEWVDPRVDVANMVLLRRGENPIMLIVPNCEHESDLCVPKDSGLYVHRGLRDGRPIYEVSPLPGSEVLACVDAHDVVTQHQL